MNKRLSSLRIFAWIVLIVLALSSFFVLPQPAFAQQDTPLVITMFWSEGCPHCAQAKPFFEDLAKQHPQIELRFYEVSSSVENQEKFILMCEAYGFEVHGVPTIFIGDRYWEGFSDTIQPDVEKAVNICLKNGCINPEAGIIAPAETRDRTDAEDDQATNRVIKVPLLGEIDLSNQPLFIATALIAFVDGVNPCSIWVLTMLIALTLRTGSRKRIALIGMIFIFITALVYALFIAGLFTFLTFAKFATWIHVVVALVALVFALVNIKDYFWYKEGVSFTISEDKKPGLFKRMRHVLDSSESLWGLITATVVLAAGVSMVEFSCTAGFPVLWTNLVSSQGASSGEFVLLLLFYMLIYQLDELIIFFAAVFTLKATKMEEKHGRILKLIGGTLMLTLAAVMIISPNLLNDLTSALIIFGVSFLLAGLILLVHRRILPSFGIWIGTEREGRKKVKKHSSQKKSKK